MVGLKNRFSEVFYVLVVVLRGKMSEKKVGGHLHPEKHTGHDSTGIESIEIRVHHPLNVSPRTIPVLGLQRPALKSLASSLCYSTALALPISCPHYLNYLRMIRMMNRSCRACKYAGNRKAAGIHPSACQPSVRRRIIVNGKKVKVTSEQTTWRERM